MGERDSAKPEARAGWSLTNHVDSEATTPALRATPPISGGELLVQLSSTVAAPRLHNEAASPRLYFKRAPFSTLSWNPMSTGLSSGPIEAATIMPLDSNPRSFRGCRLATMTTFRPISDSGW